ncbi:MAG TPA: type I glyceraldehyde-3-phosphate dehydrogenase [Candidatus Paceibacterota bacterium]|nr:type I glyceraldehyde-3-phosphate dehydrogenase [Candidatus Paceibacterota bacterium]
MTPVRIAINGFGRIGRAFVRRSWNRPEIEIVAVNDLGSLENLAYLLKYDTVYGRAPFAVDIRDGNLVINGKEVRFISEKDPAALPWGDLGVDVVIESTGVFDDFEKAQAHVQAGAKRVVISAPAKGDIGGETVLMGVNEEKLKSCAVSSNASCTTNASSPVIAILDETIGIDYAILSTTHAYTATQSIVDSPVKGSDLRRGRAAAQNIVPSSTGAAIAVGKAYTNLDGRFDGVSLRVPVPAGSIADITFVAKRDTTAEEVNQLLRTASKEARWEGIFRASDDPLVSSDIVGEPYASIAELSMTRVVGPRLVKVMAWYDNEMGYTESLVRHAIKAGS